MKTLKFVMYLFYRYYSTGGTSRIPYFSALCAMVMIIYIHIFQLLIIFDKVNLLSIVDSDTRIEKYGKIALFLLPIFFVVAFLVQPKSIKKLNYDEGKIRKGNLYLIVYIVFNFLLLVGLMAIFSKR